MHSARLSNFNKPFANQNARTMFFHYLEKSSDQSNGTVDKFSLMKSIVHRITIYTEGPLRGTTCLHLSYANICSLLARRRSSQPVQRVYWSVHAIDWQSLARASCVMRYARRQKLQRFRQESDFCIFLFCGIVRRIVRFLFHQATARKSLSLYNNN